MSAGKGTGPDKGVDWKKQRDGWDRIYGKKGCQKTKFVVANCGFTSREKAEKFKDDMNFPDHVCAPDYDIWDEI